MAISDEDARRIADLSSDRPRSARRVADLLSQESLSDEHIEELACLLGMLFLGPGGVSKLRQELKLYELSEEEAAAERELSKSMKALWLREHPEDRDREVWTGEDL